MSDDRLRVALVGGPMYDAVYEPILDEVEVVVHADHLTLNARVAELLGAGGRIDVLATHGKYVPSQQQWLHPLDTLVSPDTLAALAPGAVELCRVDGALWCVPRNIDVRVLWWRTDRMAQAPQRWSDLLESDAVFGFTGRGSGLFGLFYELVVGAGGRLFDDDARPALDPAVATEAIATIATLGARCGDDLVTWHYDEVDDALGAGRLDAAAAWPGATALLRTSSVGHLLRAAPYPAGAQRRVSYAGCHGWAIPRTCADVDRAVALVEWLCGAEAQRIEASVGGIPAHRGVLAAVDAIDAVDAERLAVTRATIADAMITYPALERFPDLEDAGAAAIGEVLAGTSTPAAARAIIGRALDAVSRP